MQAESSTTSNGHFAWHLGGGEHAVVEARHAFQQWLGQWTTSTDDIEDLEVVISELASNAIAGSDGLDRPPTIRASVRGSELHLEVANPIPDGTDINHWDLDDPLRAGGRGLMIVRAFTDTMDIDSTAGGLTVRCTRRLRPLVD